MHCFIVFSSKCNILCLLILPPLSPDLTKFQGHFARYLSAIFLPLSFTSPLRDRSVLSRLRTATLFTRPISCTNNCSFINYASNHCQLEPITTSRLIPLFPIPAVFFSISASSDVFCVGVSFVDFKLVCSLYDVVRLSSRKNVNKYLYLYVYLYLCSHHLTLQKLIPLSLLLYRKLQSVAKFQRKTVRGLPAFLTTGMLLNNSMLCGLPVC